MEYRVVAGVPATGDAHTKPAKPSDALLLRDVELEYGQTTILDADIDDTRTDTFVYVGASGISTSYGGWTRIGAQANVQLALDSVDAQLLKRTAGEISEDLIPVADTYKAGTATKRFNEAHVNTYYAYTAILSPGGTPTIGSASEQFDAHLSSVVVYTSLHPDAAGNPLGTVAAPWNATLNALTYLGAVANSFKFNSPQSVTLRISPDQVLPESGSSWFWDDTDWQNVVAGEHIHWYFKPLHGVKIEELRIRWAQASGTASTAQLERVDEDGAATGIGATKSISNTTGTKVWDVIDNYTEIADCSQYRYRVKVVTGAADVQEVFDLEVSLDVTDILKAILSGA
jgi:hypothetical protein